MVTAPDKNICSLYIGLVVVGRIIVADMCDETNIALGFSFLFSASAIGLIIRPSIGGKIDRKCTLLAI